MGTLSEKVLLRGPWKVNVWILYNKKLYLTAQPNDFHDYLNELKNSIKEPGRFEVLHALGFPSKTESEQHLSQVKTPTLVVMGTKDPDWSDPTDQARFIEEALSATIGFVIYFGVTGSSILGSYQLPDYDFSFNHLLFAILLGIIAAVVLIIYALISKLITSVSASIDQPIVVGLLGGALVGLIAFALPLTATSGKSQLATELELSATLGAGFIAAILIGKMIAVALSQSVGFLGGIVFPYYSSAVQQASSSTA